MQADIYSQIKNDIIENKLIPSGKEVLVCFSGGKNSSVMLHLLYRYNDDCFY